MKQIDLEYEIDPKPRNGGAANALLQEIMARSMPSYVNTLEYFFGIREEFFALKEHLDPKMAAMPNWSNGFLPGLDIVSIHGFLRRNKPKIYLEVGSGNSTKVARRCIEMHHLQTQIVSIDPCPRAEIDALCDRVIRNRLEDTDLEEILALEAGDILFFDGSHHAFMNSDTVVFFLEILPRLKRGVLIEIHDICLPYDYPSTWSHRCYSEQYLLASAVTFAPERFMIELPNMFITRDPELSGLLHKFWDRPEFRNVRDKHGASFWFQMSDSGGAR